MRLNSFFDDSEIVIKIRPTQQQLVLPHELVHATLVDLARQAGSFTELGKLDPSLVNLYNAIKGLRAEEILTLLSLLLKTQGIMETHKQKAI